METSLMHASTKVDWYGMPGVAVYQLCISGLLLYLSQHVIVHQRLINGPNKLGHDTRELRNQS